MTVADVTAIIVVAAVFGVLVFVGLWEHRRDARGNSVQRIVWDRLDVMHASGYFDDCTGWVNVSQYLAVDVAYDDLDPEQILPYVRSWMQRKGLL